MRFTCFQLSMYWCSWNYWRDCWHCVDFLFSHMYISGIYQFTLTTIQKISWTIPLNITCASIVILSTWHLPIHNEPILPKSFILHITENATKTILEKFAYSKASQSAYCSFLFKFRSHLACSSKMSYSKNTQITYTLRTKESPHVEKINLLSTTAFWHHFFPISLLIKY